MTAPRIVRGLACRSCGERFEPTPSQIRKGDFLCGVCRRARYRAKHGEPPKKGPAPRDPKERFFAFVSPDPNSGCWLWTGSKRHGYGAFKYMTTVEQAHRASYMLFVGLIPDGMLVCHKCDVPACVNPDHLFIGTNYDNIHDASTKGRLSSGEGHYNAKLSKAQITEIRATRHGGQTLEAIATKFGVRSSHISAIVSGHKRRAG